MSAHREEQRETSLFAWVVWSAIATVVFATMLFICASCSTVVPKGVESSGASFDGNERNSGVIGWTAQGLLITPRAMARYDDLVSVYGRDYQPAISQGHGAARQPDGNYVLTREAAAKFDEMSRWRRAGLQALKP
jgi:hypothetical protein